MSLPVHHNVLVSASPIFQAKLRVDNAARKKKLLINDVDPDVFLEVLRFIYSGILPKHVTSEWVESAIKYHIAGSVSALMKKITFPEKPSNLSEALRILRIHRMTHSNTKSRCFQCKLFACLRERILELPDLIRVNFDEL
eukprot:TRINITY_DN3225_c0_g1_i1.p1 TRINITY_DN3225_c0_g1~~TRINITY_DN3225_c0_g1_i1.p1  ORF type:complete len:157 (+),score=16.81 TRINITY_DN3225_c0_g1_i1:54-473(+)